MASLINRINQEEKTPTVLKAYSLQDMVTFLTDQSGKDAENLVIATPNEVTKTN